MIFDCEGVGMRRGSGVSKTAGRARVRGTAKSRVSPGASRTLSVSKTSAVPADVAQSMREDLAHKVQALQQRRQDNYRFQAEYALKTSMPLKLHTLAISGPKLLQVFLGLSQQQAIETFAQTLRTADEADRQYMAASTDLMALREQGLHRAEAKGSWWSRAYAAATRPFRDPAARRALARIARTTAATVKDSVVGSLMSWSAFQVPSLVITGALPALMPLLFSLGVSTSAGLLRNLPRALTQERTAWTVQQWVQAMQEAVAVEEALAMLGLAFNFHTGSFYILQGPAMERVQRLTQYAPHLQAHVLRAHAALLQDLLSDSPALGTPSSITPVTHTVDIVPGGTGGTGSAGPSAGGRRRHRRQSLQRPPQRPPRRPFAHVTAKHVARMFGAPTM